MTTPSIVVLGAMKAGTTTAFDFLHQLPGITMLPKESGWLHRPVPLESGTTIVDVCSDYGRLHRFPELLESAITHLPFNTPLMFIVRDPIDRAVSHARHLSSLGTVDHARVFDLNGDIVQTSSYGRQISRWVDAGFDNIVLVDFHDIERSLRSAVEGAIGRQSHADGDPQSQVLAPGHANQTAALRSARTFIRPIVRSRLYGKLRGLIPQQLRSTLKNTVLTAPAGDVALDTEQEKRLAKHFVDDLSLLAALDIDAPAWCLNYPSRRIAAE